MNYKGRINQLRRKLFRRLTRNMLTSQVDETTKPSQIKRILIVRPNHRLGNLLLITPLIQEVSATFPDASIDLFVKGGIAPSIFRNFTSIGSIFSLPKKPFKNILAYSSAWIRMTGRRYDLVINAVSNSSSGKLATKMVDAPLKISGDLNDEAVFRAADARHIALRPVFSFRDFVSRSGYHAASGQPPLLNLRLSSDEIAKGRTILRDLTGNENPVIALYTFATGAKCYAASWWESFYQRLEKDFSSYNIIEILPVENVSQLGFSITSYYSRDIREIAAVIANTDVFIGADSGIMHLASASGTPTIGLFAVTDADSYRPYNPGSIAIDTRTGSMCEWIAAIRGALAHSAESSLSGQQPGL